MPKRSKKKNTSLLTPTLSRSGPKKPHYRYLERQTKPGYTRKHHCAFCGREGFAYSTTRPSASLFCDQKCYATFRFYLIRPIRFPQAYSA